VVVTIAAEVVVVKDAADLADGVDLTTEALIAATTTGLVVDLMVMVMTTGALEALAVAAAGINGAVEACAAAATTCSVMVVASIPLSLAAHLFNQFTENETNNNRTKNNPTSTADHTPSADVFDTPTSYVIHISLPGAKKEDVGVNWDAEKSELSVAGVIYRPGDEEFLKTLAVDERMVGPFERKIRLGTRASPANVDADGITAKLEDGVLRVVVGKMEEGFVEIRKVDIE